MCAYVSVGIWNNNNIITVVSLYIIIIIITTTLWSAFTFLRVFRVLVSSNMVTGFQAPRLCNCGNTLLLTRVGDRVVVSYQSESRETHSDPLEREPDGYVYAANQKKNNNFFFYLNNTFVLLLSFFGPTSTIHDDIVRGQQHLFPVAVFGRTDQLQR